LRGGGVHLESLVELEDHTGKGVFLGKKRKSVKSVNAALVERGVKGLRANASGKTNVTEKEGRERSSLPRKDTKNNHGPR